MLEIAGNVLVDIAKKGEPNTKKAAQVLLPPFLLYLIRDSYRNAVYLNTFGYFLPSPAGEGGPLAVDEE